MTRHDQHSKPLSDHDPIDRSFREAPAFNRLWLTDRTRLTSSQRIGFLLISLFMLLGGAMFLSGGIADLANGDFVGIFFFAVGTPSLVLGGWGLWRVAVDVFTTH
jgi:hypothetical protein